MRGTWQTEGVGAAELVGALAAVGAVVALIWFLLTIIWILAAIAGVFIPAAIVGLIWLARHGGDMAVVSRGLPVYQRASLPQASRQPLPPPRPVQALPAPQHVHYHVHIEQREIAGRDERIEG